MKKLILLEILRSLKSKPQAVKKLKIFALVAVIFLFVTGAFTIWAGFAAYNLLSSKVSALTQSENVQKQVELIKTDIPLMPVVNWPACWMQIQSLMTVDAVIRHSIEDHFLKLKNACLETKKVSCEGEDCSKTTNL